MMIIIIGKTID